MTDEQIKIIRIFKGLITEERLCEIRILKDESTIGYFLPITKNMIEDRIVLQKLVFWRKMYSDFFVTQFIPTIERTKKWLESVVIPDDTRILFLVTDENKNFIGNFGLCDINNNKIELDNLLKGERNGYSRLFYFAELAIIEWIKDILKINEICLHVFSNNFPAILLHRSIGFKETNRYKMTKENLGDESRYVINYDEKPDKKETGYMRMELNWEDYYRLKKENI